MVSSLNLNHSGTFFETCRTLSTILSINNFLNTKMILPARIKQEDSRSEFSNNFYFYFLIIQSQFVKACISYSLSLEHAYFFFFRNGQSKNVHILRPKNSIFKAFFFPNTYCLKFSSKFSQTLADQDTLYYFYFFNHIIPKSLIPNDLRSLKFLLEIFSHYNGARFSIIVSSSSIK